MRHLIASGAVPGRGHLLAGRPCQDAVAVARGPWGAAAVVCDGCGSEPGSGLGAALGAAMTARAAARQAGAGGLDLGSLAAEVLEGLEATAEAAGLGWAEHFLFTVVGAVFVGERATVFACGDGVAAVDGLVTRLGPYPGNAPPYLGYARLGGTAALERLFEGPAERVLVGTDGAAEADLAAFWTEERFLRNPDLVRRALRLQRPADDAAVALMIRRGP